MNATNPINDLLDALIDEWDTSSLNDFEFIETFLPTIIADPINLKLESRIQSISNALQKLLSFSEWQDLVSLVKRRPGFRAKCRLQYLDNKLQPILKSPIYIDEIIYELEKEERRSSAIAELKIWSQEVFATRFLEAEGLFANYADNKYLLIDDFVAFKVAYVQAWAKRELGLVLDVEQSKVVAHTNGDLKITARAGSGKTRTLVARAAFLVRHCKVPANSILLLAFNKKAALEMKNRLEQFLGEKIPHVMTFHALAYAIVHPDESLIFDDPGSKSQAQSRAIQKLINLELKNSNLIDRIRDVMLKYFRGSWEAIVNQEFDDAKLGELNFLRSLQFETLNGEFVKSGGEKLIANILFENGIAYHYERSFKWDGINYRPDFTINLPANSGIAIEYFGLVGESEYDKSSSNKRDFWNKKPNWTLIERFPWDFRNSADDFENHLIDELRLLGVQSRKLTDEEVWDRLKDRAVDRFTEAMKTLISRCRKLGLSSNALASLIRDHSFEDSHEEKFVGIGKDIYTSYLKLLETESLEDFDGLLIRAISALDNGFTQFARNRGNEFGDLSNIQFVLVDEFQDFSYLFHQMLAGIQKNGVKTEFFCVGDDWQAINGFAGSDLTYFQDFEKLDLFMYGTTQKISTNYRSAKKIVHAGNKLMSNYGDGAAAHTVKTGQVLISYIDQFSPNSFEIMAHPNDEISPLLLRVTSKLLLSHKNLTILVRQNKIPYRVNYGDSIDKTNDVLQHFLKHIQAYLSEGEKDRVSISTTHSFKGLESDAVVILDANKNAYPLIHPTWEFFRIFGVSKETIGDEERRLFYVALTRAVNTVVLFADSRILSPFITYNNFLDCVEKININDFPTVVSDVNTILEIAIYGKSFAVKDLLKGQGYKWDPKRLCWFKVVTTAEWSTEYIDSQTWNNGSLTIEVKSSTDEMIYCNY